MIKGWVIQTQRDTSPSILISVITSRYHLSDTSDIMLIILKEKHGVFGPNVMKKMKKCDSLIIKCTRSGMRRRKFYTIGFWITSSKFVEKSVFLSLIHWDPTKIGSSLIARNHQMLTTRRKPSHHIVLANVSPAFYSFSVNGKYSWRSSVTGSLMKTSKWTCSVAIP